MNAGVCKCGTGSKCTGMQTCVSGECKCGANSDCLATNLVNRCESSGECSCEGATCNTDVSDGCTDGSGCTCGGNAQCTGNLKCTNGACACAENADCTGNTDTCVKAMGATTGECKCGMATCDATKANVCDGGTCKCGAEDECGTDATLVKCLAKDGSATTAGDAMAKCHVRNIFAFSLYIKFKIYCY